VPLALSEIQRLKSELPDQVRTTLNKYEDDGDYDNPEYKKAVTEFYNLHVYRSPSARQELKAVREQYGKEGGRFGSLAYETMWGENDFTCTGTLAYWDISDRLGEISVPCLVTGGKFDEVTPTVTQDLNNLLPDSKIFIFQDSAHVAFWEERAQYIDVVRRFLDSSH
jgi:proline iminopeptidase